MIQEYDWYESINIIYKKIDSYMLSHFNANVQCDAAVIREQNVVCKKCCTFIMHEIKI